MVSRRNAIKTIAAGSLSITSGEVWTLAANDHSTQDVRSRMPAHACDCHLHVIGPYDRFPMTESRVYTPPTASLFELEAMHRELGVERTVLIQPSFYGADNDCLLSALKELGPTARGVAVVSEGTTTDELDHLRASGITGIRINRTGGTDDPRVLTRMLERAGKRAAELGWHVEVFLPLAVIASLAQIIEASPALFVLDHFAGAKATGVRQEGFERILGLLKSGKAYSKLSAPYHESLAPDYVGMGELTSAFIRANPERVLWGTDWPHTSWTKDPTSEKRNISPFYLVNNVKLLEWFFQCVPDASTRETILVRNPAKLFGFN